MVTFEQPPEPARPTGRPVPQARIDYLAVLRQHPGRWAKYLPSEGDPFTTPRTIESAVSRGGGGFEPKGAWQVTVRQGVVYIRYVGQEDG